MFNRNYHLHVSGRRFLPGKKKSAKKDLFSRITSGIVSYMFLSLRLQKSRASRSQWATVGSVTSLLTTRARSAAVMRVPPSVGFIPNSNQIRYNMFALTTRRNLSE